MSYQLVSLYFFVKMLSVCQELPELYMIFIAFRNKSNMLELYMVFIAF